MLVVAVGGVVDRDAASFLFFLIAFDFVAPGSGTSVALRLFVLGGMVNDLEL